MTIPTFVMEPGAWIAFLITLRPVRTSVAEIVLCTYKKLSGWVFGQIMGNALPYQAYAKAFKHHKVPVVCYGSEMLPGFQNVASLIEQTSASVLDPARNLKLL